MSAPRSIDKPSTGSTKQSLTVEQQQLLAICQQIRFGRIPQISVRKGQPVLVRGLTGFKTVKILGKNAPHPASQSRDCVLRGEVRAFFDELAMLGHGEILDLQIVDGMPDHFDVEVPLTE